MRFLGLIFLFILPLSAFASDSDSLIQKLNLEIKKQPQYVTAKERRIETQKTAALLVTGTAKFHALSAVYNEYRSFIYDSAFLYANELQQLAYSLNNAALIRNSKLKMAFVLVSSGLFNEALDTLETIRSYQLSDSLRFEFHSLMARTYYDMADFSRDTFFGKRYAERANSYIDSAMTIVPEHSKEFLRMKGLKLLHLYDMARSQSCYEELLTKHQLSDPEFAVVASTLSFIYFYTEKPIEAKEMLIRAAIADIRSCTKETLATIKLAEMFYNEGDIENAYKYVKTASQDAEFYGARQRKVQVAAIYPVIEGKQLTMVESKRKMLVVYSLLITVLALSVIGFSIVFYKQNKKLQKARRIISKANESLTETNHQLQDANKIKEEYIWYYFNTTAEYISKLDSLKKTLELKLMTKKLEDLRFAVDGINIKRERDELYHNFDRIFLKLFPDFVSVFNSLLKEEDRVALKEGQLLNTELRIFALIRMGIHDHERIAKILDYSVTTIYTYKTRVRSKAIVPGEDFDKRIMSIRAI
jgi:DNA-binding CsgD family transcriptional regulator